MNEEEIIKEVESAIWFMKEDNYNVNTFVKAIQGLLDLYKEKNKQIQVEIEGRNILVGLNENLKEELKKEKEKNKILELTKIPYLEGEIMAYKENDAVQRKMLNDAFDRGWIHKDKIRKKIKEYEETRQKTNDDDVYIAVVNYIDVLEDLLEEE